MLQQGLDLLRGRLDGEELERAALRELPGAGKRWIPRVIAATPLAWTS